MHRFRKLPVALVAAGAVTLGACSDGSSPSEPLAVEPGVPPELAAASYVADVNMEKGTINISGPANGVSQSAIADYFGLEPGHPELSILGEEVVEVIPNANSLAFGDANGLKRRVAFEVTLRNRLSSVAVRGPTELPIPPSGTSSPILFPIQNVPTVTQGGATGGGGEVIVEVPSEGEVAASDSIWDGPPHNFFNDESCGALDNDCFVYKPIFAVGGGTTLGGLQDSEPVRLGWDVDLTVSQFRSRLILAGDLVDDGPNTLPTPAFGPAPAPGVCQIGVPLELDGSASTDDGFLTDWDWDFGDDGTVDATGQTATFTASTAGPVAISLTVTDNRGDQAELVQTYDCQPPPANTVVTLELQNTAGQPITEVQETGTYRYFITVANPSPTDVTLFNFALPLDSDIDLGSVAIGGPAAPVFTLNGSTIEGIIPDATLISGANDFFTVTFTVAAGTAPGPLTANVTSGGAGEDLSDNNPSSSAPIVEPANVLARWMSQGGIPITESAVGQTVYLQICTLEDIEAVDGSLGLGGTGSIVDSRNFESDGSPAPAASAVHPDCVGSDDQLDDSYLGNLTGGTLDFGVVAITPPSSGRVGIVEVEVQLTSAGTISPSLNLSNFQLSASGTQGTPTYDIQTLTVN